MQRIAVVFFLAGCLCVTAATPKLRARPGHLAATPAALAHTARHHHVAAPAAAGAPAPAGPTLKVLRVDFDLVNVNYYDLTATEDGSSFRNSSAEFAMPVAPQPLSPEVPANDTTVVNATEEEQADAEQAAHDAATAADEQAADEAAEAAEAAGEPKVVFEVNKTALVAVRAGGRHYPPLLTPSVLDNVLGAVHVTLEDVALQGLAGAPGPAGAASPAAGAVVAASPAASPAPAPTFDVHVTVHAGEGQEPKTHVEATIVEVKNNGIDEEPQVAAALQADVTSGLLEAYLEHSIFNKTGVKADVADIKVEEAEVAQWSSGVCGPHVTKIVKRFVVAYTRAQVPKALYNECTNFMPKLSFSHDGVLNHADSKRCQAATLKFAKTWNYGKGSNDTAPFCLDVCEMKFGKGAAQCHVESGDALAGQAH